MTVLASILLLMIRATLLAGFVLLFLFPALWLINHYQGLADQAGLHKAEIATNRLAACLLWIFGVRVRLSGEPADGPVLIAANHLSWLDTFVLHSARAMGFVGKAEIDHWPLLRFMAHAGGTIFHQRGSHASATDAIARMVERLQQGQRVAIFPEGGVLPGARIHVFHARMFRAAVDAACPVQPVMVRYLKEGERDDDITFRKGENMLVNVVRLLSRRGVLADVRFLPLIDATGMPRRALAEAVRETVSQHYES